MPSFAVPNRPNPGDSTDITKILADYDAILADLDSVANARRLLGQAVAMVGPGAATGSYWIRPSGALAAVATDIGEPPIAWWLDPAVLTIAGKNLALRLKATVYPNTVSSGTSQVGVQINSATVGGSLGKMTIAALGTLQASVLFAAPVALGNAEQSSGFPTAGLVAPIVTVVSAAMPSNAAVGIMVQLFAEWS